MRKNLMFIHASLFLFFSCAGPNDPFGAINFLDDYSKKKYDTFRSDFIPDSYAPKFGFYPPRQVLHAESDFSIVIEEQTPIPDSYELKLYYNDKDVTKKFLSKSKISKSEDLKTLTIAFSELKLLPTKDHEIVVAYRAAKVFPYNFFSYNPPHCKMNEINAVREVASFDPSSKLIDIIAKESKQRDLNPSFMTALVAQESSFNPQAVSWAKAIGLTQVTNLASTHVVSRYKKWPQNKLVSRLNFYQVKRKIQSGVINKKNDWRLDPYKSIIGGIYYIDYLQGYWKKNDKLLDDVFDKNVPMEDLILASYNSGAYRVKKAVRKNKGKWINDKSLTEAKKYVNKIKSYCYHFSDND